MEDKLPKYKNKPIDKKKWFLKDGSILIGYPAYGENVSSYTAEKGLAGYNKHKANGGLRQDKAYADPIKQAREDVENYYDTSDRKKFIKYCEDMIDHFQEALVVCEFYGIDKSNSEDKIKYFSEMKRIVESEDTNISTEELSVGQVSIDEILQDDSVELATEASKNPKRKKVEEFIISYIKKIVTGDENVNLYKNLFKSMSDSDFDKFMKDIRDDKARLSIIVPNGNNKIKVDVKNNFKIAKELGFDFFQRLKIEEDGQETFITPTKHVVYKMPIRRASQLLSKKISVPRDTSKKDLLTGQVTGDSASSKITNPETQVLIGLGMKDTLKELMKIRGGDNGSLNAMNKMLYTQGSASQDQVNLYQTGVTSTKTLKMYFLGMHIRSTL